MYPQEKQCRAETRLSNGAGNAGHELLYFDDLAGVVACPREVAMRIIRMSLTIIAVLFVSLLPVHGQADGSLLDDVLNFDVTVRVLYEQAQRMPVGPVESDDWYILDGHVAAVSVLPTDDGSYLAEIELVTGSWDGLRRVNLHRVIVIATEDFEDRISARPVAQPGPGLIVAGIDILVAGRVTEIRRESTGRRVPVVRAERIRTRR